MTTKFDITLPVDVGSTSVIHSGDDIAFAKKNTLHYNGLLSNSKTKDGYYSTYGNKLNINKSGGIYVNGISMGNTACIRKHSKEEIESATGTKVIKLKSVVTMSTSLVTVAYAVILVVKDNKYQLISQSGDGKFETLVTTDITYDESDVSYFIDTNTPTTFSRTSPGIARFKGLGICKYNEGIKGYTTYVFPNDWSTTISLTGPFTRNIRTNNGFYFSTTSPTKTKDCLILGLDINDQREDKTYMFYGTGNTEADWVYAYQNFGDSSYNPSTIEYMGRITALTNSTLVVTGEPFPVYVEYDKDSEEYNWQIPEHYELDNGVIAWENTATRGYNTKENKESILNSAPRGETITYWPEDGIQHYSEPRKYFAPMTFVTKYLIYKSGQTWLYKAVRVLEDDETALKDFELGSFVTNHPYEGPGQFWDIDNEDKSVNSFFNRYLYTNISSDRGKYYDYGQGWTSFIYEKRWALDEISGIWILSGPAKMESDDGTNRKTVTLDSVSPNLGDYGADGLSIGKPTPDSSAWFEYADKPWKSHLITETVKSDKAWPTWTKSMKVEVGSVPFIMNNKIYYNSSLYATTLPKVFSNTIGNYENAVLLCSTELDEELYSMSYKGSIAAVGYDKDWWLLSTSVTPEIVKIADYVYKVNNVSPYVLIENKLDGTLRRVEAYKEVNYGTLKDFPAGFATPSDGSLYNDTWLEAAGYNVNMDDKTPFSSSLLPATNIPFYLNTDEVEDFNHRIIDRVSALISRNSSNIGYDVYYTHTLDSTDNVYRYTLTKGGTIYKDTKKEDNSWWADSSITILPVGLLNDFKAVNFISPSITNGDYTSRLYVHNNQVFMDYNSSKQTYGETTIFTIMGSEYYFDGQAIYYASDSNDFICYCSCMKFLANSGTEAYFYSEFDKHMYIFSGSGTLHRGIDLSDIGIVKEALFNSSNQSLYILTEDGELFVKSATTTSLYDVSSYNVKSLQNTKDGIVLVGTDSKVLSLLDGDILPIEVESEWIGDSDKLYNFSWVEFILYSETPVKLNVEVMAKVLNNGTEDVNKRQITINTSDWKSNIYKLRLNYNNTIGNACKFGIKSNEQINIMSIVNNVDQVTSGNGGTRR